MGNRKNRLNIMNSDYDYFFTFLPKLNAHKNREMMFDFHVCPIRSYVCGHTYERIYSFFVCPIHVHIYVDIRTLSGENKRTFPSKMKRVILV